MKKLTFALMLVMAFSTFIFADGDTPGGGKTCPPTETCRADDTFIETIKDFLIGIFV